MTEKKSKAKGTKGASTGEKPVRRRKPDAMARAQAEVDGAPSPPPEAVPIAPSDASPVEPASDEPTRPAVSFVEALLAPVAPAGRLVEPSGAPAPRQMTMADLPARERRALAFHASDFHRDASQIEAFEAGTSGPTEPARAIQGTRRLVELGLLQERHAYFVTPLGKAVAASGGITVTRPVALDAAPAEVTS